jgi:DNA-binding CsgD family transcriptional regulator
MGKYHMPGKFGDSPPSLQDDRPHAARTARNLRRRRARQPNWTRRDQKINALLLKRFPSLRTNLTQRRRAAFWHEVILQYWREFLKPAQIAVRLNVSADKVSATIKRIERAGEGLRTDGNPRTDHNSIERRIIPVWASDSAAVNDLLDRSFPERSTNERQRSRSEIWYSVISMYWRQTKKVNQIAAKLNISKQRVRDTIRSIKRAAAGRQANGKPRSSHAISPKLVSHVGNRVNQAA